MQRNRQVKIFIANFEDTEFFNEEYTVVAKDGNFKAQVLVPVRHGEHEKDNHDIAGYIAELLYPGINIKEIIYN